MIQKYKLGTIEGNREFLTQVELESLEKLYNKKEFSPGELNVLRYFILPHCKA